MKPAFNAFMVSEGTIGSKIRPRMLKYVDYDHEEVALVQMYGYACPIFDHGGSCVTSRIKQKYWRRNWLLLMLTGELEFHFYHILLYHL